MYIILIQTEEDGSRSLELMVECVALKKWFPCFKHAQHKGTSGGTSRKPVVYQRRRALSS